jgi:type IV pilus assembly protein PilB
MMLTMDTFDPTHEKDYLEQVRSHEEEDVAHVIADKYGIPYIDLSLKTIDADALRLISEDEARAAELAIFERSAKEVSIALRNPESPLAKERLEELSREGYTASLYIASRRSLEKAFSQYRELSFATTTKAGISNVSQEMLDTLSARSLTRETLRSALEEAASGKPLDRITRLFETILAGAFILHTSDIHFEPGEHDTLLRLRIDGVLYELYRIDPATYHQINSRIKLLSGVKLNITNEAQDGRFSIQKGATQVEMRVSFIPGNYGESIVMRILDPEATKASYKELGIHPKLLARLESEIRRPNGMLLTTGPTGSGKTTTLYSFLREMHRPEIKIITIEDPIEYHLDGIVQTQVEGEKYTFAEGLRSIVRQDPDIIMVGEIRDGETAEIAIQAALTGHFVFSTLHTNNAAGTFPRLADLGADPKSFGSAVTVSMAQRLVRTLRPEYKRERPLTPEEKETIAKIFAPLADQTLLPASIETVWEPDPEHLEDSYHGRVGLYEAIFMTDELATFLRDNPPENEIAKQAATQGYLTMAQDGVLKALAGTTSLDEVFAVVDLPR